MRPRVGGCKALVCLTNGFKFLACMAESPVRVMERRKLARAFLVGSISGKSLVRRRVIKAVMSWAMCLTPVSALLTSSSEVFGRASAESVSQIHLLLRPSLMIERAAIFQEMLLCPPHPQEISSGNFARLRQMRYVVGLSRPLLR
jgi:hypothetical protein